MIIDPDTTDRVSGDTFSEIESQIEEIDHLIDLRELLTNHTPKRIVTPIENIRSSTRFVPQGLKWQQNKIKNSLRPLPTNINDGTMYNSEKRILQPEFPIKEQEPKKDEIKLKIKIYKKTFKHIDNVEKN